MRTEASLRRQYLIERELADRLRAASREERTHLYSEVYDELFRRVPDHPQHHPGPEKAAWVRNEARRLERFVAPGDTFVEVGAGDCALAIAMARRAGRVIAVDVSDQIVPKDDLPANLEVVLTDGRAIPVEPGTADVVYSNQLMEHLHPDDAQEQLANIARALRPGGRYVCVTPNRAGGPSDISMLYDEVATGFHLREYTIGELVELLRGAGFREVRAVLTARTVAVPIPTAPGRAVESVLLRLPHRRRRRLAQTTLRRLLGITVVATR